MQKIAPHLWYDKEAREAAEFYTSVFPRSKITHSYVLQDTPSGDCDVVSFEVMGEPFQAISAGPHFKFNPSISFMVNFDPSQDANAEELIDEVWNKLVEGGEVRMPIDKYDWSPRYGWVSDRYGLDWQLILTDPQGDERPLVLPALLFVKDVCGKAKEASDFHIDVFGGKRGALVNYPPGMEPESTDDVMFTDYKLLDRWFVAMDSANEGHHFAFNEAVSFMVSCDTQEEIDTYWSKLSAVPEAQQCGWLKDTYGVSWQIVPAVLENMMKEGSQEQIDRVTQVLLQMKKFDIASVEEAYNS